MKNVLIGKTLLGMQLAEDDQAIRFLIANGPEIVAQCDGDCCSHTWVEHIELPALGFPALITAVDNLDLPGSEENHPDHDCLAVYGLKISTDKGEIIIDYRNSSNGYYGGNISWPDERHYGGVYGQNNSNFKWKEITA